MNILILSEYFPNSEKAEITGGVESRAFNVAKRLAKRHKVRIITSWHKGLKRKDRFLNFDVYRVGPNHHYSHAGSIFSRLRFVDAAVNLGRGFSDTDIIDGYSYLTYLAAYEISKKIKKPRLITYHETWLGEWIKNKGLITGFLGEMWEGRVLRRKFDKIISVSKFTKMRLVNNGVKQSKIVVIPNGVDIEHFNSIKAKKSPNPTICCINRLTPKKKVDDIIKALSIVRSKIPNIRCKIIGKGIEMDHLNRLVRRFEIEKNVDFVGFLENYDDVIRILKTSHVFCSASVVEGFGMVVVEAMASSVPYVCSDIAPFREITEGGKGGLLFKAEDYKDLAEKIIKLFKDNKLYKAKIREEKELVKKYSWDKITNTIEEVYKSVK